MAGEVGRAKMKNLQKLLRGSTVDYPWRDVVDHVLGEPVDQGQLTRQALRSQRDWVVRGGRQNPGRSLKRRAKGLLASVVARLIFMALFIPAVIALLVLLKHGWPELDIYRALDWLAEAWPSVFAK